DRGRLGHRRGAVLQRRHLAHRVDGEIFRRPLRAAGNVGQHALIGLCGLFHQPECGERTRARRPVEFHHLSLIRMLAVYCSWRRPGITRSNWAETRARVLSLSIALVAADSGGSGKCEWSSFVRGSSVNWKARERLSPTAERDGLIAS